MNFKVSNNVDKVKYHSDVNFGKRNQDIVLKYLCLYFSNLFNETIEVKEFQNNSSRFDFYLAKKNILIELKSRRCTYEAYPTQIIGENKVKLAKKKMDNGYRVFYCFLLQDNLDLNKMNLYMKEDTIDSEYEVRTLGNFARNDKRSRCCIIQNTDLKFISSLIVS
tara:strand:+ start:4549 stop:5043 length:495 start_codon:yes stop_codon:yes gene_type:complete